MAPKNSSFNRRPAFLGNDWNTSDHRDRHSNRRDDYDPRPQTARFDTDDGQTLTGRVKWFDDKKGYGFIEIPGRKDAFLHISVLERAGHDHLDPGTTVVGRVTEGSRSTMVEVESVDASTAEAPPQRTPRREGPTQVETTVQATVKFFDTTKGFGFLTGPGYDIFVHVSALQRSNLEIILEGETYLVGVASSPRGKQAVTLDASA